MTILWWARTCCSTKEPVYSWDWCFTVGLIHFSWEIKWDLELCRSKPAVCLAVSSHQMLTIDSNFSKLTKLTVNVFFFFFLKSCCDVSYTLILKLKQRTTRQLDWLVKCRLHAPSNKYALLSLWNPWTWETPTLDLTRSNSWKISTCNAGSTPKPETKDNKHKLSFTNII